MLALFAYYRWLVPGECRVGEHALSTRFGLISASLCQLDLLPRTWLRFDCHTGQSAQQQQESQSHLHLGEVDEEYKSYAMIVYWTGSKRYVEFPTDLYVNYFSHIVRSVVYKRGHRWGTGMWICLYDGSGREIGLSSFVNSSKK